MKNKKKCKRIKKQITKLIKKLMKYCPCGIAVIHENSIDVEITPVNDNNDSNQVGDIQSEYVNKNKASYTFYIGTL